MAFIPDGQQVADFLGRGDDPTFVALAGEHVPIITAMTRAYTRDNGFDADGLNVADEISAVIITSTARLLANPDQVSLKVGEVSVGPGFNGWNLAETFVLNRYRKRAQ